MAAFLFVAVVALIVLVAGGIAILVGFLTYPPVLAITPAPTSEFEPSGQNSNTFLDSVYSFYISVDAEQALFVVRSAVFVWRTWLGMDPLTPIEALPAVPVTPVLTWQDFPKASRMYASLAMYPFRSLRGEAN